MKKTIKYILLFLIPVLIMSSVVVGRAVWQESIKNDSVTVDQTTYTIKLYKQRTASQFDQYANYEELNYDSGLELPAIDDAAFDGYWYASNSLSGTRFQIGYHLVSEFSANENNIVMLYAKATIS